MMPDNETGRTFFLGAGASVGDGYPTTSGLIHAVAHELNGQRKVGEYRGVREFLTKLYSLEPRDFDHAADNWKSPNHAKTHRLPDITELLSLIDVSNAEGRVLGWYKRQGDRESRPLKPRELDRLRMRVVRALSNALTDLQSRGTVTRCFVDSLMPGDTVITTNWDDLLDKAMFERFGPPGSQTLGTDAEVVSLVGREELRGDKSSGPRLLKLHGSFTWLYCPRCTRLYVNPRYPIAGLALGRRGNRPQDSDDDKCHCSMRLREVLITPSYLKDYRNRHLENIWAEAQYRLALSPHWVFAGYSLPADDFHIRALLLRARLERAERGLEPPRITVALGPSDRTVKKRFRAFFGGSDFCAGFEKLPGFLAAQS